MENVVADDARALILVRPDTEREYRSVMDVLHAMQSDDTTVVFKNTIAPVESNVGFERNIARGFSEIAFFKNSIEFGAGDIAVTHTDYEHIARHDLNILSQKLQTLLQQA